MTIRGGNASFYPCVLVAPLEIMRKVPLVTGEYYHVYNRGVDRRCTFEDGVDYGKLYQSLYLFNDANYRNTGHEQYFNETLLAAHEVLQDERNPYVSVLSYCLMPNHFHLMLLQETGWRNLEVFAQARDRVYPAFQ